MNDHAHCQFGAFTLSVERRTVAADGALYVHNVKGANLSISHAGGNVAVRHLHS